MLSIALRRKWTLAVLLLLTAAPAASYGAADTPVPMISFISPVSAAPGGVQFTLTVNGANFAGPGSASIVEWNGASLATTFLSSDQLTAIVPAALIAASGSARITIANSGCAGSCTLISNAAYFPLKHSRY